MSRKRIFIYLGLAGGLGFAAWLPILAAIHDWLDVVTVQSYVWLSGPVYSFCFAVEDAARLLGVNLGILDDSFVASLALIISLTYYMSALLPTALVHHLILRRESSKGLKPVLLFVVAMTLIGHITLSYIALDTLKSLS